MSNAKNERETFVTMNMTRPLCAVGLAIGMLAACGAPTDATRPDEPIDEDETSTQPEEVECGPGCTQPIPACSEDLSSDPNNCGACGISCGDQICGDGICNTLEWGRALAASIFASAEDVAVAPDGSAVVVGSFDGDFDMGVPTPNQGLDGYVAKVDDSGLPVWLVPLQGDGEGRVFAVDVDADGTIAVAGAFTGLLHIGANVLKAAAYQDAFVATFSPDGGPTWAAGFGDANLANGALASEESQRATDVAFLPDGSIAVGGAFVGSVAIGDRQFFAEADFEMFVARFDDGALAWARGYVGLGEQLLEALAVTSTGDIVLVGSYSGELDLGVQPVPSLIGREAFAARLSMDGDLQWRTAWRGPGDASATAVAVSPVTDVVYVAGAYQQELDLISSVIVTPQENGSDIFYLALDDEGAVEPVVGTYGGERDQIVSGLAITDDGEVLLAGHFSGKLDFFAGEMDAGETVDAFVARLRSNTAWSQRLGGGQDQRVLALAANAEGDAVVVGNYTGPTDLGDGPMGDQDTYGGFVASFGP